MAHPSNIFAAALGLLVAVGSAGAQSTSPSTSPSTSNSGSVSTSATTDTASQAAGLQCGGVGSDDQERMKAAAAKRGLLLTFASASGAYLADVDVRISRGGQVVVQGRCTGPLMLVDLAPAGNYEIRAVSQGREQRKAVTVGNGPARVNFTWPDS